MNTMARSKATRGTTNGRHKPVRWFSVLMSVAVLSVSGAVVADVVLTYFETTSITPTGAPLFTWQKAGNYALANQYGLVFDNFTAKNAQVATTLGTLTGVSIELVNVTSFNLTQAITAWHTATVANVSAFGTAPGAVAGVACAWAIVTTYQPISNAPRFALDNLSGSHCLAFVPGAARGGGGNFAGGQGCGSPEWWALNLTSGVPRSSATSPKCNLGSTATAGPGTLFVSYGLYTGGAVVATALDGFSIGVNVV